MTKKLTPDEMRMQLQRAEFAADQLLKRLAEITEQSSLGLSEDRLAELNAEFASITEQIGAIATRMLENNPAPHLRRVEAKGRK